MHLNDLDTQISHWGTMARPKGTKGQWYKGQKIKDN